MVEFIVTENEAGQKMKKLCFKYLNLAPGSFIYKMLRKKNIVLNDKKASGDEVLQEGDSVKFYLADDTIRKFRQETIYEVKMMDTEELGVIYEDKNIMIVNKPYGILSQKAKDDDYTMNEKIIDYCLLKGKITKKQLETFKPSVCNRLDRNTSGLLLAGVSLEGSQYLSKLVKERSIDKEYYAIVHKIFEQKKHVIAYLYKHEDTNKVEVISEEEYFKKGMPKGYVRTEAYYEPVEFKKSYTLLKIKLVTGKSHQIRAHLGYLGYPIIGDNKYGNVNLNASFRDRFGLKHHLLHAGEMTFPKGDGKEKYPFLGKTYKVDPPEIFTKVWENI
jgi:23S rRNA pseudouridine955/2504/2580 synthase